MASIIMPPAISSTPMEMRLKPEAKIPVPNFLVTENMSTPAAMAANAAINEPACMAMESSGSWAVSSMINN